MSSTTGSTPESSPPAAARAADCTFPGTTRFRPNAAPGSGNPATSTPQPAKPSPVSGTEQPGMSVPADILATSAQTPVTRADCKNTKVQPDATAGGAV